MITISQSHNLTISQVKKHVESIYELVQNLCQLVCLKTADLTLGLGTTEKVFMILSGYSSRILEMRRVPIPLPVPPPKEWVN